MSTNVLNCLRNILKEKDRTRKLVLASLLSHADTVTCTCYPSVELIAADAGCDLKLTMKTLRDLENDCFITRINGQYRLDILQAESKAEENPRRKMYRIKGTGLSLAWGTMISGMSEDFWEHPENYEEKKT